MPPTLRPDTASSAPVRWDATVSARWHAHLTGDAGRHGRTRTSYYAAVGLLLNVGGSVPAWSDIIEVARPRGSRSTFYDIVGSHARHSLLSCLLADGTIDTVQLAWCCQRTSAVERLIDEAKVWTYWPYRERIPRRRQTSHADMIAAAVRSWTRANPGLARALSYAPPICAVEDLLLTHPHRYSAISAARLLSQVVDRCRRLPGVSGSTDQVAFATLSGSGYNRFD